MVGRPHDGAASHRGPFHTTEAGLKSQLAFEFAVRTVGAGGG